MALHTPLWSAPGWLWGPGVEGAVLAAPCGLRTSSVARRLKMSYVLESFFSSFGMDYVLILHTIILVFSSFNESKSDAALRGQSLVEGD